MAPDGRAHRLRPGQHLGAGAVAPLRGQRSRDVGDGVGVDARAPPAARHMPAGVAGARRSEAASAVERLVELLPGHRLGAPVVGERAQRLAGEPQRVRDPGEPFRTHHGTVDHLPAGVAQRDQVPGEIPAVDRRDVLRVERTEVARVVPVVEVAAEALEPVHRRRASPPAAPRCRAYPASRSRGRRPRTAGTGRGSSATSGGPPPASDLPGSCRAGACDPPP